MKLSWTKILLGALAVYIIYKMFFTRENLSEGGAIGFSVAFVVALFLFVGFAWINSAPTQ